MRPLKMTIACHHDQFFFLIFRFSIKFAAIFQDNTIKLDTNSWLRGFLAFLCFFVFSYLIKLMIAVFMNISFDVKHSLWKDFFSSDIWGPHEKENKSEIND